MSARSVEEKLTRYLADVHAIEVQALAQLEAAPGLAGHPRLAAAYEAHRAETEVQERLVRGRLEQRDAGPSALKDAAGRAGGWAMVAFARMNPDTPGKLAAHAFSYEHMERAAYELLTRVARRAGDERTAAVAQRIAQEERAMAARIADGFDEAVDASLRAKGAEDLETELIAYLRDAHAIEEQSRQLLRAGVAIARCDVLAATLDDHLAETLEQQRLVAERLEAYDATRSRIQDAGMRIGGLNLAAFLDVQPDTAPKLAGFAYAVEHLEVAAYELLARVAQRAGDGETALMAQRLAAEEREAARRIADTWDAALDSVLEHVAA